MKSFACAIGFALAALPAFGVSIVQQTTLTTQHFQTGNGTPYVTGSSAWSVNGFDASLGSLSAVTFSAEILCTFSSTEVNPYLNPQSHTPGFFLTTSFYLPNSFDAPPLYLQANGSTITMDPGSAYTFSGTLTGTYGASGLPGDYIGTSPLMIFAMPRIFGLNANGSAMADVTINARLTYDYSPPGGGDVLPVPDAGYTITLIALSLIPLLWLSGRRRLPPRA